ncbi:hypothetical protein FGB62_60g05 [Gracilaria domingensis]|nr:hypothetical protein FGB62_60g05 [Gracilaria domingensis]
MASFNDDSSAHRTTPSCAEWDTRATPIALSSETSGKPEGPIASRLRSRRNSANPRILLTLAPRRHRRSLAITKAESNDSSDEALRSASPAPTTHPPSFDRGSSASVRGASPTALTNAVEGPIASRLRSRTKPTKPRGRQTLRPRRQGRRTPVASRNSPPTTTAQTTPPPTPSSQRRGRKRDASCLSDDRTVSEAVRSPLVFSPDAAAATSAITPPPPKRRRPPVAVRDRTVARALSPSLSRAWKTKLFLEQRRAMERNSGLSLAHYASLVEAAAAGVAFSRREGFMPREAASGEAGPEAQSDDARAVPQPMRRAFVASAAGGAVVKEELSWEGCAGCGLCTEQTLLMYIDSCKADL